MSTLALRRPAIGPAEEDCVVPIKAPFRLESGDVLDDDVVRLRRFGPREAPQVVVLGGISSGRFVCGERGWWSDVVDSHVAFERHGVVGLDFAPLDDARVRITPFDQARLLEIALDRINVRKLHGLIGASYGGMVGLAFAALFPERLERLCVISAAHRPSALSSGWRGVQRRIVEFGLAHGDGEAGLSLARQLAMITYRSGEEFERRFGSGVGADGRGELDRYLVARGEAYRDVISPQRWLSLSEAIDRFRIEPERVSVPTAIIGCPSDQLVLLADVQDLAWRMPHLLSFDVLPSVHGHDAFLKEPASLAPLLQTFLESPAA